VLGLGTIDAAYDARGRSVAEVTQYLVERFGLPRRHPAPIRELLRRKPPACIVIDGVDRAADPGALMGEVLRTLVIGAQSRGVRLVLGFDGPVPENLPYEVSLGPEPITGGAPRACMPAIADVEACIAELAAAEAGAAILAGGNKGRLRHPPMPPPARTPRLRVRLAVTRGAGHDPEIAAIEAAAVAGLGQIAAFRQQLHVKDELLAHLRRTLEAYRGRAARRVVADDEDEEIADLYAQAARALWQAPIDLDEAAKSVARYIRAIGP